MTLGRRALLGLLGAGGAAALGGRRPNANTPAATRHRGYAEGPYGLVHFQDTGGDGLPVILSHQSPQSSRQFDTVLPELAKRGIRAIAVDTPGFGMSDATPFEPRIEDYARAFPCVLDRLNLPRADFVGHHTGAQVVTEVTLQFPSRVRRLVLHGPNPMPEEERLKELEIARQRERGFVYEPDGSHLMRSFQVRWRMYGEGANPELTTRVIAEKFIGYGPFWYGHSASYSYNHAAALAKLRHPTLIMTNTGDEIYAAAQRTRALRPDFAYRELAGGTVDIVDQQPAAWAEAIAGFLHA